jgi:death on curing protein
MQIITLAEVEYIAYQLAKKHLEYDEPIPDFSSRFPNVLESCLTVPFQKFFRKSVYPTFTRKASMLFYLMIKNHPFQNGNKRIAMTTLFLFLYKNHKWLKVDNQELYNFAMWVASSPANLSESVVDGIQKFIRTNLVENK